MRALLAVLALTLAVASCGDSEPTEPDASDTAAAQGSQFDVSSLPDDFPQELLPPEYDFAAYQELAGTRTASFESASPVDETIDHYTDLLGDPTLDVEGEPGERNVQWQQADWIVSVVGSVDESIIGITAPAG